MKCPKEKGLFYSPPFGSVDVAFLQRLANVLPLRFKAVHLLSHEPISNYVESRINFADETYVHVSSSNDELASQLEEFGMYKAEYLMWQEFRTRVEWRIPLSFSGRDRSAAFDLSGIRPYSVLPENEKAERSRRLNVVHCRRKRNLKHLEAVTLEEECTELRGENKDLLQKNRRLEDLVRAVVAIIEQVEEEQGDSTSAQA
jgi:hypothetical protein